jgi:hypothetical protein
VDNRSPRQRYSGQITGKFIAEVKSFAAQQAIPLFHFERKESKDQRAHQMRRERKGRWRFGRFSVRRPPGSFLT